MGTILIASIILASGLAIFVALRRDLSARTDAWRRIAEERRWNWEQAQKGPVNEPQHWRPEGEPHSGRDS